jgi:hypothetical protein
MQICCAKKLNDQMGIGNSWIMWLESIWESGGSGIDIRYKFIKNHPSSETDEPLIFSSDETDLIKLGSTAFDSYMAVLICEKTPLNERITSYKLNDISVLAGDINEFCVSLNYDFTTDNDS